MCYKVMFVFIFVTMLLTAVLNAMRIENMFIVQSEWPNKMKMRENNSQNEQFIINIITFKEQFDCKTCNVKFII